MNSASDTGQRGDCLSTKQKSSSILEAGNKTDATDEDPPRNVNAHPETSKSSRMPPQDQNGAGDGNNGPRPSTNGKRVPQPLFPRGISDLMPKPSFCNTSCYVDENYCRTFQHGDGPGPRQVPPRYPPPRGLEYIGGFPPRRATSNDEPKPNLIVNYLPQTLSDQEFYHMFAPFGQLESIKIMRDTQTGYSFGYGFVNYVETEDAVAARGMLNGTQLEHKRIKVSFARPPSDDIRDTNLFVTGLPTYYVEQDLDRLFSPYGVIVHLRVLRDKQTRATRGVAFVRYETRHEACTAILEMNGTIPPGGKEPIRVRLAQDHGKQKAAYIAGYQAALSLKEGAPGTDQLKTVPGTAIKIPDIPLRHSETSFTLYQKASQSPPQRNTRGRPATASATEGVRVTTSSSDPTLYWKGFVQGVRVTEPRRTESHSGKSHDDRQASSLGMSFY